jgi:hypothetical protein
MLIRAFSRVSTILSVGIGSPSPKPISRMMMNGFVLWFPEIKMFRTYVLGTSGAIALDPSGKDEICALRVQPPVKSRTNKINLLYVSIIC